MAATHPFLSLPQRQNAIANLRERLQTEPDWAAAAPVPGGVGYGVFYTSPFRAAFSLGTSLYWEIVCPTVPGGNVTDFLYITGMNRASLGVEALVKYRGQTEPSLLVYDWSQNEDSRWQLELAFQGLAPYLRGRPAHGTEYQVLPLMNMTYQADSTTWMNQVWLLNGAANRWDLAYQHQYPATAAVQHGAFVGSWGPIVETFQDSYHDTNGMGALSTQVSSYLNGQWNAWIPLTVADSQIRADQKGFLPVFLDPNASWVIHS